MSKQVKDLITKELTARLKELDGVGVLNPRGIDANKNHGIRRRLHEKGLKMMVVKNTLAKRAVGDGKLKGFDRLLDGPSAVVYGKASISSIARALLAERKANEKLELRGMFFDGEVFAGDKGVEQVSKMPTREEAVANIVASILGPGRKLAAALKGPGSKLGAVLKTIEDKAKEKEAAAPAPA
ncbi:MAG TPA: 50S ribosomal protein L10 [Tepidisphaeraceae bacterium]|jgi:large subunit ribosomal protein L10